MNELEKIAKETSKKIGVNFYYYAENTRPKNVPVCEKQFEGVTDDGQFTFFRFYFKGTGYVGAIEGATGIQKNYATLLPAYIESFTEKESDLSKTEYLRKILQGECSSLGIYKYATKFSIRDYACFALVIRVPKMLEESMAIIGQYNGNSLDTVVKMSEDTCVLVKYVDENNAEYQSSVDYAEFLAQSLEEELGVEVSVGVGTTVHDIKDIAQSYARAENAIRYADEFETSGRKGKVHSYREFVLVKMLEEVSHSKLTQYLYDITDESFREIFDNEEMLETAEEFLHCSLNVSETSRNLYMHRNTLLYRLDKIEKATGLNIRCFPDAVSFRVLTLIYRLLGV